MVLLGITLFCFGLVVLTDILVPLSIALLLAILLNPFVSWLQKMKVPRIAAIALAMIISLSAIAALVYVIAVQVAHFSEQLPVLRKQAEASANALQNKIAEQMNISRAQQHVLIENAKTSMKPMANHALGSMAGSLAMIVLLPVYTFLLLFYKTLILNFIYEVFENDKSKEISKVLMLTKSAIQSYTVGLLLEALIVAVLNATALFLFGVQYALVIAVIGALLNMLPYVGGLVAISIPVIMLTITKGGYETQMGIVGAYLLIQFIDNQFIVPYVVSSQVKINALVSIVVVFVGGAAWGLSGMFLSIPFIGVLKIVLDNIPELKPWGKLLGDKVPARHFGELGRPKRPKSTLSEKIAS